MSAATKDMHVYCTRFGCGIVYSNEHDDVNDSWITKVIYAAIGFGDMVVYTNGIPISFNGDPLEGHFIPTLYYND